jgi:hypothetical protein
MVSCSTCILAILSFDDDTICERVEQDQFEQGHTHAGAKQRRWPPLSVLLVTCVEYLCTASLVRVEYIEVLPSIPAERAVPSVQLFLLYGP